LITTCVRRIEVRRTEIAVSLLNEDRASNGDITPSVLTVPWCKTPHRTLLPNRSSSDSRRHPGKARHRNCARGRQWLSEIEAGAATIDGIASRQACSERHVSMTISLGFLAPRLVKAALEGRLPRGIGVARLFDAPVAWSRQQQMLGLSL
jgi:site-specific DNA recombinase